jgi:lipase ATG15
LGKSIVYDTVGRFGWRADVRRHAIREVITRVLEEEGEWENGREVPMARAEEACVVSTFKIVSQFTKSQLVGLL